MTTRGSVPPETQITASMLLRIEQEEAENKEMHLTDDSVPIDGMTSIIVFHQVLGRSCSRSPRQFSGIKIINFATIYSGQFQG
jgi:hypothetical protein